jgi:hypothetical protein
LEKGITMAEPMTRRIKVTKAFYAELAGYLEPTERVVITEGEIGTALVLWTLQQKRLMFYYQEPVAEPPPAGDRD